MPPRPTKPPGKKGGRGQRAKQMSTREIYAKACAEAGLHPNSGILEFLSERPGVALEYDILDVSRNYLGDKGLIPLLAVVERSPALEVIILRENGLRNNAIRALCETVTRHPSIRHIDVSDNFISEGAAVCLAQLLEDNNKVCELIIDNTKIDVEWRVKLRDLVRTNAAIMEQYAMEQQLLLEQQQKQLEFQHLAPMQMQ